MTLRLNKEYFVGEAPYNAFASMSIFDRDSVYDDLLALKDELTKDGSFEVSDEMSVSRIENTENGSSDGLFVNMKLYSDSFSR